MENAAPGWFGEIALALEQSAFGATMRESLFLYPLANVLHIFGLILLVGGIGLLDLRILGFGRALPLAACSRYLTPVALVGLGVMVVSGFSLFSADAGPLSGSGIFRVKLLIVAAALANAVLFRILWQRRLVDWDANAPLFGRLQSAGSLVLWFSAATAGRLIGYG